MKGESENPVVTQAEVVVDRVQSSNGKLVEVSAIQRQYLEKTGKVSEVTFWLPLDEAPRVGDIFMVEVRGKDHQRSHVSPVLKGE